MSEGDEVAGERESSPIPSPVQVVLCTYVECIYDEMTDGKRTHSKAECCKYTRMLLTRLAMRVNRIHPLEIVIAAPPTVRLVRSLDGGDTDAPRNRY